MARYAHFFPGILDARVFWCWKDAPHQLARKRELHRLNPAQYNPRKDQKSKVYVFSIYC